MAAIDFPNNPQIDDIHIHEELAWSWDGVSWKRLFEDHNFSSKIGVGTSAPQEEIHIRSVTPVIRIEDIDGGYMQIVGSDGSIRFDADNTNSIDDTNIRFIIDGSEKFRIDSDGKVGIGTYDSPSAMLDIYGDNPVIEQGYHSYRPDGNEYVSGGIESYFRTRDTNVNLGAYIHIKDVNTHSSFPTGVRGGEISFGTVNGGTGFSGNPAIERMRIDADGNVDIGNSSSNVELKVNDHKVYHEGNLEVDTAIVFSTAMQDTPEQKWVSFTIPHIGGSGTSNYYYFDVYGYSDIGTMDSQLHYRLYIHVRADGTNENAINIKPLLIMDDPLDGPTEWDNNTEEGFNFYYTQTSVTNSKVWIHLPEDYSALDILSSKLESGGLSPAISSMFAETTTQPSGLISVPIIESLRTEGFNTYIKGSVGIGTSTPSRTLELVDVTNDGSGGLKVRSYLPVIELQDSSGGVTNAKIQLDALNMKIGPTTSSTYLTLNTEDTPRMTIDRYGKVGIGTTSPTTKLEILGSPYVLTNSGKSVGGIHLRTENLRSDGEYTNAISFSHENHTASSSISGVVTGGDGDNLGLAFITHPSSTGADDAVEAMRINNLGNVGIGTQIPNNKLDVRGSTSSWNVPIGAFSNNHNNVTNGENSYPVLRLNRLGSDGVSYSNNVDFGVSRYEDSGTDSRTQLDISLAHTTSSTANVMSLRSDGNVGIGTSAPSAKLSVVGDILSINSSSPTNLHSGFDSRLNIYKYTSYNSPVGELITIGSQNNTAVANGKVFRYSLGLDGGSQGQDLTISSGRRGQTSLDERMRIKSDGETLSYNDIRISKSFPKLIIDSPGEGDSWTSQGAMIALGESAGTEDNAALYLTYNGNGNSYIGTGGVNASTGVPLQGYIHFPYNSNSVNIPSNVGIGTSASSTSYKLNMGGSIDMNNYNIDYVNQLHFQSNVRFYDESNDSYLNYKWGDSGSGGIKFYDGNSLLHGYVFGDGSGAFGLLSSSGEWGVKLFGNGETQLFYNNYEKLNTKSTGVDITGDLGVSGAITEGGTLLSAKYAPINATGKWDDELNNSNQPTGDILYNGGNVGIGVNSVSQKLRVNGDCHFGSGTRDWIPAFDQGNSGSSVIVMSGSQNTGPILLVDNQDTNGVYGTNGIGCRISRNNADSWLFKGIAGGVDRFELRGDGSSQLGNVNIHSSGLLSASQIITTGNIASSGSLIGANITTEKLSVTDGTFSVNDVGLDVSVTASGVTGQGIWEPTLLKVTGTGTYTEEQYTFNPNKLYGLKLDVSNINFPASETTHKKYAATFVGANVGIGTHTPSQALHVQGNIYASGTLSQNSDITLKENLEVIEEPIEKIKKINGYTFNMIDNEEEKMVGLVAQEVEEILPELIFEDDDGIKSLAYGNVVALLVECIKKQDERIESQDERIKDLEKTIQELS